MAIMAPTEEAGKSKIIDVAQYLARAAEVVHDPSPASLFRMIDASRPSLFIDEVDMIYESKGLKTMLNAGYRYGSYVTRAVKIGDDYVPMKFNVFCPKMFAGIAGKKLPITGATLSRCVQLAMRRRSKDEHVEKFYHKRARQECQPIRQELMEWAKQAVSVLERANPPMPDELTDRQEECWEPLIAIADYLGGDWPKRARSAALILSKRVIKQPTEGIMVIVDMKRVWDKVKGDKVHTQGLATLHSQLEDRMYVGRLDAQELSTYLTRFGIHPESKPFRLSGSKPMRGYKRSAFADAFKRYCDD